MEARGIQCDGAESCSLDYSNLNSMQVLMTGRFAARIKCDGSDSCRGVTMDLSGPTDVECNAANGCRDATMDMGQGTLFCRGTEACANTDITTLDGVFCYATRSCRAATVQCIYIFVSCIMRYVHISYILILHSELSKYILHRLWI